MRPDCGSWMWTWRVIRNTPARACLSA